MRAFGFLCLFLLMGTTAFMCSSNGGPNLNPGINVATWIVKTRKLMGVVDSGGSSEDDVGKVSLEDYRPIDPAPNSEASIRHRPIQHDSPLMPYIPKPSPPPARPKHGG